MGALSLPLTALSFPEFPPVSEPSHLSILSVQPASCTLLPSAGLVGSHSGLTLDSSGPLSSGKTDTQELQAHHIPSGEKM